MMEFTTQQVFTRLGEARIIDVRERDELVDGMISSAPHLPLSVIRGSHPALDPALDSTLDPALDPTLDPTRPVIVVCRSGRRSAAAAEYLAEAGFDAHTMAGGMLEWTAAGLPLVMPQLP